MNLDEVEKVLGPGKLVSETKTEKHVYDLYAWETRSTAPA